MDAGFVDWPYNLGVGSTLLATHAEKLHKWQWRTEHETDTEMCLHVQEEQGPSPIPVYLDYFWQVALISMELMCHVKDSYSALWFFFKPRWSHSCSLWSFLFVWHVFWTCLSTNHKVRNWGKYTLSFNSLRLLGCLESCPPGYYTIQPDPALQDLLSVFHNPDGVGWKSY